MKRLNGTYLALLAFVFLFSACASESDAQLQSASAQQDISAMTDDELAAYAEEIHERVLTLDTHDDIPFDFATEEVDPGVRGDRQVDLPKMREGKLDVGTFIVYVGQTERTPANYEQAKADAMTKFNAIHRMAEEMYPDEIGVALVAEDVQRIHESGKLVAAIAIENGYVIGHDLALLAKYKELGANYMTLAHNGHNDISDSANPRDQLGDDEEEHAGISDFGTEVIAEMNRVGILVDVSHISMKAAKEAAALSKAPIVASHSGTKAINDVSRNMDDEAMLALQKTGGVINIVALDSFVKQDPEEKRDAVSALREEYGISGFGSFQNLTDEQRAGYTQKMADIDKKWPGANVSDFVDHIDYAVKLIGIDHVGISSDFDGGGGIEGWNNASESQNVTLELVRRGYTEEEIGKLWSGNYLRAWAEAERIASELQGAD
jgi:membrane dipeptidase